VTGPGELWLQVEDTVIAQNMHEAILKWVLFHWISDWSGLVLCTLLPFVHCELF